MKNFYEEAKSPELLMADKQRIIPPKHDVMFKILFGKRKKYLADLLSKILHNPDIKETDFEFVNTELTPDWAGLKSSRLDLTLSLENKLVNIEIQVQKQEDFKDRSLFYWSKLFTNSLNRGQDYNETKKALIINFVDFDMFDDNAVFHEVTARESVSNKIFSDKFALFFFELPKISGKINVDDDVLLWLEFLAADSRKELDMLRDSNNVIIKEAVDDVFATSESRKAWAKAWIQDKAEFNRHMDLTSAYKDGLKKGETKGKAKGLKEGKEKGLKEGEKIAIERIRKKLASSNLSDEEIDKLLS